MRKTKYYLCVLLLFFIAAVPCLWKSVSRFFAWYILLNFDESPLSLAGQITCRLLTLFFSFSLVGYFFSEINWFRGWAMRIAYFVVSLVISAFLSVIIMLFERHMLLICVILIVVSVICIVLLYLQKKKKAKNRPRRLSSEKDVIK